MVPWPRLSGQGVLILRKRLVWQESCRQSWNFEQARSSEARGYLELLLVWRCLLQPEPTSRSQLKKTSVPLDYRNEIPPRAGTGCQLHELPGHVQEPPASPSPPHGSKFGISSRDKTSLGSDVVRVDPQGPELSLLPWGIPFLPPSLPPG